MFANLAEILTGEYLAKTGILIPIDAVAVIEKSHLQSDSKYFHLNKVVETVINH